jgi:hypothetical protein
MYKTRRLNMKIVTSNPKCHDREVTVVLCDIRIRFHKESGPCPSMIDYPGGHVLNPSKHETPTIDGPHPSTIRSQSYQTASWQMLFDIGDPLSLYHSCHCSLPPFNARS